MDGWLGGWKFGSLRNTKITARSTARNKSSEWVFAQVMRLQTLNPACYDIVL